MSKIFLLFISLNLIFICHCKLENEEACDLILVTSRETDSTGTTGVIAFKTNSSSTVDIFDESDIEKQNFDSQLVIESGSSAKVKCSLFKPKEKDIYILCNLQEKLSIGKLRLKLSDYILYYKNKKIKIFSEEYIEIDIKESNNPYLYADKQIIDLNDGKNVYELKFKIKLFNEGDSLVLGSQSNKALNHIKIRNYCTIKENELICNIDKNAIEGHILSNEETFVAYSFCEKFGMINHHLILDIIIKYKADKENINVQIKKLLNGNANSGVMIAYETDVTQISQCTTKYFDLNFTLEGSSETKDASCFFKKNKDNKPLLLLCTMYYQNSAEFTLSQIKEEMKLEDINIKYNFIIKPEKNDEKINYSSKNDIGGIIFSIHPNILDFTKKDSYSVGFGGDVRNLRGLAIEPNLKKDLDCVYESEGSGYIHCTIPKSYFEGQKNGDYYAYQNNHLGTKSPCYEAEPIKVVLADDSKSFAEKLNILKYMLPMLISFILF